MNRRNFLKIGAGLLVVGGIAYIVKDEYKLKKESSIEWKNKKFEMEIGKRCWVHNQFLIYNGMSNEQTFSMSGTTLEATNIYYPTSVKEFNVYHHRLRLEEITPEKIILTYLSIK